MIVEGSFQQQNDEIMSDVDVRTGAADINDYNYDDNGLENNDNYGKEYRFEDYVNQRLAEDNNAMLQQQGEAYDENAVLELKRRIKAAFHDNEVSQRYFLQDLRLWGRSGVQCIVGRALKGCLLLDDLANEKETTSLLLLTEIMTSLTEKKREALVRYLAGLVEMLSPFFIQGQKLPTIPTSPHVAEY